MSLGALRPSSLVDQATRRLRDQITSGEWPVGTRLPGETTLAKDLGVGRSTVREAVRALAGAGLVRARQGAGVFVVATEPAEDWPARLRRAAVVHVYEVRTLVEVQAARLAAERRTDADIAALHEALAARRAAAAGDDAAFVDADIALHAAVVASAHNPVLTDLFAEFVPALRRGLIDLVNLLGLRHGDGNPGDDTHAALVGAVERGDAEAACRTLQDELDHTMALLHEAARTTGASGTAGP
ncbi:FadR family transcriptional regulator [Planomonospora sp. ID91781]|uniref:GntR family transcriptional regulator n=1 Tax=Planomonospora sphaerica TaxID=161355 RepID=A0A171CHM1_9ACTN|nr:MULTISPECIES: FCD domain-containing protein [Planomonospora]MBG0821703.1 FadR family transcriptional regulator [Planomonospora sp. ID91781]GAT66716.1 gntR family transcriptional regulator [Planomonospora sphaerica]